MSESTYRSLGGGKKREGRESSIFLEGKRELEAEPGVKWMLWKNGPIIKKKSEKER